MYPCLSPAPCFDYANLLPFSDLGIMVWFCLQVIIGSFTAQDKKELTFGSKPEILSAPPKLVPRASASGSSPSRGTLSESSGGPGSPPNQSTGAFHNSNLQGMSNMPWK